MRCSRSGAALRIGRALLLLTFAGCAIPALAPARAAAQALDFLEAERHVPGIDGLDGAAAVAVAPGGLHAYVASGGDDAVSVLQRNPVTLAYTWLGRVRQGEDGVDGLEEPRSVAVSPDGAHVYVGAGDAIAIFARSAANGALGFVGVVRDGVAAVDGLAYVTKLALSPDGAHLYATSLGDNAVSVFARNAITGELTLVEVEQDGVAGVDGLASAGDVVVSPDGANVYVASAGDDAIAIFSRNAVSGVLTYAGMVQDGVGGVNGLAGVSGLAIEPNGGFLYGAGYGDDAIAIFLRFGDALLFVQAETDLGGSGRHPSEVAVSEDGAHVYVTLGSFASSDALAAYSRSATFGTLTLLEVEVDGVGGAVLDLPGALVVSGTRVLVPTGVGDTLSVFSRNGSGLLAPFQTLVDAAGTDGIESLVVSPDGAHAYAALYSDDAVAWFLRDAVTGGLAFGGVVRDGVGGATGLDAATGVATSPAGDHVYAVAALDDAISVFARSAATGALTPLQTLVDGAGGVDGLDFVRAVTVSPDGAFVYAGSDFDNSVAVFARSEATGLLTYQGRVRDGVDGVDGLYSVRALAVSPDGAHLYAAGGFDDAVAAFVRNPATGLLTYVGQVKDGVGNVDGLDAPEALSLSPDGKHLYVASLSDDAVAVFARDAATGALGFVEVERDGVGGADGLDGASSVRVSPDGALVVVSGRFEDAVQVFARDGASGALAPIQVVRDGAGGVDGLDGVAPLAFAPGGEQLYAGGSLDRALVAFGVTPPADADLDGVIDASDNCPFAANADQADVGGIGTGSAPDGIGDACQCGDVNGDGRVTVGDAVIVQRASLVPPAAVMAHPERCNVGGAAICNTADSVILRRGLLLPPTATIAQACAPALP